MKSYAREAEAVVAVLSLESFPNPHRFAVMLIALEYSLRLFVFVLAGYAYRNGSHN